MPTLHNVQAIINGRVLTLQVDDSDFAKLQAAGALVGTVIDGKVVPVEATEPEEKAAKPVKKNAAGAN